MKEYVQPSIKQHKLLVDSHLLEGSITEGEINNDNPGLGTDENPIVFEAPQQKHFSVWDE